MPYSVELFFDPDAEEFVRRTWDAVDNEGFSRSARPDAVRPHITLGVWKQIELPAAKEVVKAFAAEIRGLKLNFASVGTFARTTVVYFAPTVTRELLEIHRQFHERFAGAGMDVWGHYLPGHWTPHCTIGERVAADDIVGVIEVALDAALPITAHVRELGIVQHPGAIEVVTFADDGGETTKEKQ